MADFFFLSFSGLVVKAAVHDVGSICQHKFGHHVFQFANVVMESERDSTSRLRMKPGNFTIVPKL